MGPRKGQGWPKDRGAGQGFKSADRSPSLQGLKSGERLERQEMGVVMSNHIHSSSKNWVASLCPEEQ